MSSKPRRRGRLEAGLLGVPLLLCIAGCGKKPHVVAGRTMGTTYRVAIADAASKEALAAADAAAAKILERVDKGEMSTYAPESGLSRFNASSKTGPVRVSAELHFVIEAALRFHRETGGAFDPTVGPLVELWGFGPGERRRAPPSPGKIRAALRRIGASEIHTLRGSRIRKDRADLRLDLSGIAKGYGADAVAEGLDALGFENYMVEVGGEVFARGLNAEGAPWRIGIEKPEPGRDPGRGLQARVPLSGRGLATSGSYRNYFEAGGTRYQHILDPRTGRPADNGAISVSVSAPSCMEADAVATALMVMGVEEGLAWVEAHDGFEAYFISEKEGGALQESASSGFRFLEK